MTSILLKSPSPNPLLFAILRCGTSLMEKPKILAPTTSTANVSLPPINILKGMTNLSSHAVGG